MMNLEKKISIIIPVYNTQKYLERCLDSIIKQTYRNLQIICVNDCSTDESLKILQNYANLDERIHIVNNEKNLGLFHARLEGVKRADGDYIAFVDSDDYVSLDFYRCLLAEAITSDADIVFSKIVEESDELGKYIHNLSYFYDFNIGNKAPFEALFEQQGRCYIWHTVWNKIYKKSLWDAANLYLKQQDKHLIMAEDVAFSSVIFYFAKKISYVDYSYYFYFRHKDASTGLGNFSKFLKNINDLTQAFSFVKKFLMSLQISDDILKHYYSWRDLYARFWFDNVKAGHFHKNEEEKLLNILQVGLGLEKLNRSVPLDHYFYSVMTPWNDGYYELQNYLIKSKFKYYSFDIFDTLIVRPFLMPEDLFSLLEPAYQELFSTSNDSFFTIRKNAESLLRKSTIYGEVTLDEIYECIHDTYCLDTEKLESLKIKEKELEINKCYARKSVLNLYLMLKYMQRQIIIVSDIYLDFDTITQILHKNSIVGYEKIFLSSIYRNTKQNGSLFEIVVKTLKVPAEKIFHIGDNYDSDFVMAKKRKLEAYHYQKSIDVFRSMTKNEPCSSINSYYCPSNTWLNTQASKFIGVRSALAICSNKLFDNPYVTYNHNSNFNCCSQFIGYFPVGMFLLGVIKWIEAESREYHKIHFIGRDGYLFKKAYDELYNTQTNYLELSRKALLPVFITKAEDIMHLGKYMSWNKLSPSKVLDLLRPVLSTNIVVNETIRQDYFSSEESFNKFLHYIINNLYDSDKNKIFQSNIQRYFKQLVGKNNTLFDIGYSGRSQIILSKLLGYNVDGLFIHINSDENLYIQSKLKINIKTYYPFTPSVTGGAREYIFSKQTGSLIGFDVDENCVALEYENYSLSYVDKYCIQEIQQKALDFISDFKKFFKDEINLMYFRNIDISIPFEILMHNSPNDLCVFNACVFEDELYDGRKNIILSDIWRRDINYHYSQTSDNINNVDIATNNKFNNAKRWKKAICYYLLDKKLFKQKLKHHLRKKK